MVYYKLATGHRKKPTTTAITDNENIYFDCQSRLSRCLVIVRGNELYEQWYKRPL